MAVSSDEDSRKRLLQAVKDDDCDGTASILNTGYDVNAVDPETRETLVIEACRCGSPNVLELLIKRGGNTNHQSKSGRSPLHVSQEYRSIECTKILLQTPNIDIDVQDNFGATPLMLASHRGFREGVVVLLDHGCNPELKNQFGWTALHYCVTEFEKQIGQSKVSCLEELVNRGANMNVRSKGGYSPLHTAVQMGHYDSVRTLVHENCATDIDAQAPMDSPENTPSCSPGSTQNQQSRSPQLKQDDRLTNGAQSKQPIVGPVEPVPGRSIQSKSSEQANQPMRGLPPPANPSGSPAQTQKTLPMTPLAMALFFGHMSIVELLLQHDSTTTGLMEITTQVRRINPFLREAMGIRSLKKLSRESVRRALGQQITTTVVRLGLEPSLTKFLLCEESV